MYFLNPIIGRSVDMFGPRLAISVGGGAVVLASFSLAFVGVGSEFFLFPIFVFFSVGGVTIMMGNFYTTNYVMGQRASRVIGLLNGSSDSSILVALFMKTFYQNGASLKTLSLVYAFVSLALLLVGNFFLIPPRRFFRLRNNNDDEISSEEGSGKVDERTKLLDDNMILTTNDYTGALLSLREKSEEVVYVVGEMTLKESLKSPFFILMLLFLGSIQLKLLYFTGNLITNLEILSHFNRGEVNSYVNIFGYITCCGIFVSPCVGFLFEKDLLTILLKWHPETSPQAPRSPMDIRKMRRCIVPFAITGALAWLFSLLTLPFVLEVQIVLCILFLFTRSFLFASFVAYLSTMFPSQFFGKIR